jgi:GH25 family lysozyme M1 (1,4-beta-N-acetylmuramidase)
MTRAIGLAAVAFGIAACTVYQVGPGTYAPASSPPAFDRSWHAAAGALEDQGVQITAEDRANGVIRGRRGKIDVSASVRTQADGSVRVQFNTAGATAQDPTLIDRISRAYDQRMGR